MKTATSPFVPSAKQAPARPAAQSGWRRGRRGLYLGLGALAWGLLIVFALLAGIVCGGVLFGVLFLGRGPTGEPLVGLPLLLAITAVLAWLVARYFGSARRVAWSLGVIAGLLSVVGVTWAWATPERAVFIARELSWGDSSLADFAKFPERPIANAGPVFEFARNPAPRFDPVEYRSGGELKQADFEDFLAGSQTVAFIVIQDDAILYEGYFNGYSRDSIVTSFSVAKSFASALVGVAIDEGSIGSVEDPITRYLPELRGRGLDTITVRHLLTMSSGIRWQTDDELPGWKEMTQFTDEGLAYYYPNLRRLALGVQPDGQPAGAQFNYNNYNTLLLGLILERTTGQPVAEYLQEKLWKPLGMEYPASWSLDSAASGFELMGSGINAHALDFARFGRLMLHQGNWNGTQVVPAAWVAESTAPSAADDRAWRSYADWQADDGYYQYLWWGKRRAGGGYDFMAQGHLGQWIFVSPVDRMVIVRFGLDDGGVDSWVDVFRTVGEQFE
jgi:CubicO group peptidase (beta-lactamase class C family)